MVTPLSAIKLVAAKNAPFENRLVWALRPSCPGDTGAGCAPRRARLFHELADILFGNAMGRNALDADQHATELGKSIVIETKPEFDTAMGNTALGQQAPDDFLQNPVKVHSLPPDGAAEIFVR